MISVGILGGTGYTGKYLLYYCSMHPKIGSYKVYGHSTAGSSLSQIFPELIGIVEDSIISSIDNIDLSHDLYFLALPHGEALKYLPMLAALNKKVIDLGGDFRLKDRSVYEKWYGLVHSAPELLDKSTYGLYEFTDYSSLNSELIANPGCYPTSVLLGLIPLMRKFHSGIVSVSAISYSGTSGAGKTPKANLMFSEMFGNTQAYNVNKHRHQPEIYQELNRAGYNGPFSFTPHLLPVSAGIYTTISIHMNDAVNQEEINSLYETAYSSRKFVRMRKTAPELKWVTGTNFCDINVNVSGKVIIVTSCIDNLIKGAAGQAMQNLNGLFGFDESMGILPLNN